MSYQDIMATIIRYAVLIEALKTEILKFEGSIESWGEIRHDDMIEQYELKKEAAENLVETYYDKIEALSVQLPTSSLR